MNDTPFFTLLAGTALFASACVSGTVTLGTDATSTGTGGGASTGTAVTNFGTGGASTGTAVTNFGTGGGPGNSACSDLVAEGPMVLIVFEAGPPPNMGFGGMLADGTYDLTATTIYQSMPTTELFYAQESIRISGGGTFLEDVSVDSGGSSLAETIAPSGASLNAHTTCPGPGVLAGPNYTATADQISIVNGLYVDVFTRRP